MSDLNSSENSVGYINPYKQFNGYFTPEWMYTPGSGFTANERAVYAYLAKCAGEDGKCFPGIEKMCEKLDMSDSTVRRAIKGLKDKKYIESVRRTGKAGLTNYYVFIGYKYMHGILDAKPADNEELTDERASSVTFERTSPVRSERTSPPRNERSQYKEKVLSERETGKEKISPNGDIVEKLKEGAPLPTFSFLDPDLSPKERDLTIVEWINCLFNTPADYTIVHPDCETWADAILVDREGILSEMMFIFPEMFKTGEIIGCLSVLQEVIKHKIDNEKMPVRNMSYNYLQYRYLPKPSKEGYDPMYDYMLRFDVFAWLVRKLLGKEFAMRSTIKYPEVYMDKLFNKHLKRGEKTMSDFILACVGYMEDSDAADFWEKKSVITDKGVQQLLEKFSNGELV
jgi:hypothetical protein